MDRRNFFRKITTVVTVAIVAPIVITKVTELQPKQKRIRGTTRYVGPSIPGGEWASIYNTQFSPGIW